MCIRDRISADQTIELTQYFLTHYIINPSKVYINGYSGGGETLSLVLAKQPELYTAALMCSSQWEDVYKRQVRTRINRKVKTENLSKLLKGIYQYYSMNVR